MLKTVAKVAGIAVVAVVATEAWKVVQPRLAEVATAKILRANGETVSPFERATS